MYPGEAVNSFFPGISFLIGGDNTTAGVIAGGDDAPYYSGMSDFFFQVVYVSDGDVLLFQVRLRKE